jgi:hypothetical protein
VELHNHPVNVAKLAIQMFKDVFISMLATTDTAFPLQLWDELAAQVQDTLNLLRALGSNPAILAFKSMNGP